MNKLDTKGCPLCGDTHHEHVFNCTDFYASGEQFELFRCMNCGFLFTRNYPHGTAIDRYYESTDYISHTDTKKGLTNRLYHQVRKYMLGRKVRLVIKEAHQKTGRLLDIGTGTGYFPAAMQRKGWQVNAVEKNKQAREFGRTKFGIDVKDNSALMEYAPGTFDVITLWHVLEHIENLDEMWMRFYDMLTETGILIIAVPNSASYDARFYGADWAAYDVPRHLWHFTPATIQMWGSKYGFVLADRQPMLFDAFYISMLSEKNRKNKYAFAKGMGVGAWSWMKTLGKKDNSSSMIYIFRKKRNGKETEK